MYFAVHILWKVNYWTCSHLGTMLRVGGSAVKAQSIVPRFPCLCVREKCYLEWLEIKYLTNIHRYLTLSFCQCFKMLHDFQLHFLFCKVSLFWSIPFFKSAWQYTAFFLQGSTCIYQNAKHEWFIYLDDCLFELDTEECWKMSDVGSLFSAFYGFLHFWIKILDAHAAAVETHFT